MRVAAVSKRMARIKVNVAKLSVAQKLLKSAEYVNLGSGNDKVPGNAAVIAALAAAHAALQAAETAAEEARMIAKQRTADRDAALEVWTEAVNALAAYTQSVTGGDAAKILSAGFDVRKAPSPIPVPPAVTGLTVQLTDMPGHSKVSWNESAGAEGYLLQGSPDPTDPTSWTMPVVKMKTKTDANGASPGQKYWYRLAPFNAAGQGPWTEPVCRPVL